MLHSENSQWDSNPHAKYPQVSSLHGRSRTSRGLRNLTPLMRARLSVSPWEIEKSFSKAIYHIVASTGQLLQMMFFHKLRGCNEPIAGYLPFIGTCFLSPRCISITSDSKELWLGQRVMHPEGRTNKTPKVLCLSVMPHEIDWNAHTFSIMNFDLFQSLWGTVGPVCSRLFPENFTSSFQIGSGSGSRTQPSPGYEPSMQPMHRPAILKS